MTTIENRIFYDEHDNCDRPHWFAGTVGHYVDDPRCYVSMVR